MHAERLSRSMGEQWRVEGEEREERREEAGRRGGGKQTGNVHLLLHIHLLIFDTLGRQTFLHVLHGLRHHLSCMRVALAQCCMCVALAQPLAQLTLPSLDTPCRP